MKKLLCLMLTAMVLFMSTLPVNAEESDPEFTEGYYTYTVTGETATIIKADSAISGKVEIPASLGGYKVNSIEEFAFTECKNITALVIPEEITTIGAAAFLGCSGITELEINAEIEIVEGLAFQYCSSLKHVAIPDTVKIISGYAFAGCERLESIVFPKYLDEIHAKAFAYCNSLKEVTLPPGLRKIDTMAFVDCSSLESLVLPDGIEEIGFSINGDGSPLKSITILDNDVELSVFNFSFDKSAVIYGYSDSTAEKLAGEYGIKFVSLGKYEHTHRYIEKIISEASCGKNGEKEVECYCGVKEIREIPATLMHKWGEWVTVKTASYTQNGEEKRICEVCKNEENRLTEKLEMPQISYKNGEKYKNDGDNIYVVPGTGFDIIEDNNNITLKITDAQGKEVKKSDIPGSGMKILAYDKEGTIVDEDTVIVICDNNGDGAVTASDARTALRASVGLDKLQDWQKQASDVVENEKNTVTAADARYILRASVSLENIETLI